MPELAGVSQLEFRFVFMLPTIRALSRQSRKFRQKAPPPYLDSRRLSARPDWRIAPQVWTLLQIEVLTIRLKSFIQVRAPL